MLSEGMILLRSLDNLGYGEVPAGGSQVPGVWVSCPRSLAEAWGRSRRSQIKPTHRSSDLAGFECKVCAATETRTDEAAAPAR